MTDLRTNLQNTLGSAYTLERELGGGGMSRVFVAEETAYGRRVVVKVLPPDIAAGVNVERFRREIQVAARLLHAHVVPVLTSGETNGVPYYTMPFVDGESLRHRLLKAGALAIGETISILRDVAKALAYAHEHGVVHRDIKPDNVLLSGGSASVADFGIAKAISAARSGEGHQTLTQMGTSIGTPAYMAPEQAAADPASNHRADIYSFGCLAYEALAGRPPFVEATPQKLLAAQMSERPRPILELRPDTPPALAELVMRCLQKDADDRPQQAAEIIRVLETVTSGGGHSALPPVLLGGAGMMRRALLWYAGAFVAVLILTRAAIVGIGLPDWVLAGAAIVMLLGLPVILFTGYVQSVAHRTLTLTPGSATAQTGAMQSLAMKASPHLSWGRTARGGVYAFGAFIILVGTFMALRAAGVGPFGSLLAAGRIRGNQALLLTDFRVVNGDSTLGPVISEAVRSNIAQSKVIRVLPQADVAAALERMRRQPLERLTLPVAQEIAVREGIPVIIDGELAGIGSGFLVTVRLVTADSARELASYRQAANGPADLIDVVDKLSGKLRGRIGESLKEVRASAPLDQATTNSIPALRKMMESHRATADGDFTRAIALLREAVALDTAFTMAYRELSEALDNAGMNPGEADSLMERAFMLSHRLPERERLIVTGEYYQGAVGARRPSRLYSRDRVRAVDAYLAAFTLGDRGNTNSVGNILLDLRRPALAESLARIRNEVDPSHGMSYASRASYQLAQAKIAAAETTIALARSHGAEYYALFQQEVKVAVAKDSIDRALKIADSVGQASTGQRKAVAARLIGSLRTLIGQPRAAARAFRDAERIDSVRGAASQSASGDSLGEITQDAWFHGPTPQHIRRLDALRLIRPELLGAAALYGFLGSPDRGRAMIARWRAETRDTAVSRREAPALHRALGEIALAEKQPRVALAEFRMADTTIDGPAGGCAECAWGNIARAYDAAGDVDSAIVSLERALRFMKTGSLADLAPAGAPFEKRLGELYEQKGDRGRAFTHYTRFVQLWKDAEPELQPTVADVRRRLARLSDIERP